MRARAAAGAPPLPPGVRRPPTPAAGRAHCRRPVAPAAARPSMPAVSARAVRRAVGGAAEARPRAAAYAPISEQDELGEKTQISSLDASMLAPEAAPGARAVRGPAHGGAVVVSRAGRSLGQPAPAGQLGRRTVLGAPRCRQRQRPGGAGFRARCRWRRRLGRQAVRRAMAAAGAGVVVGAGGRRQHLDAAVPDRRARGARAPPGDQIRRHRRRAGGPDHRGGGAVDDRRREEARRPRPAVAASRHQRRQRSRGGGPGRGREVLQEHGGRDPAEGRHQLEDRRPAPVRRRQAPPPHTAADQVDSTKPPAAWPRRRSGSAPRAGRRASGVARRFGQDERRVAAPAARARPAPAQGRASTRASSWPCSGSSTTTPPSRAATTGH